MILDSITAIILFATTITYVFFAETGNDAAAIPLAFVALVFALVNLVRSTAHISRLH